MKIIMFLVSIFILILSILFNSQTKYDIKKDLLAKYIIANSEYDIENINVSDIVQKMQNKYGGKIVHNKNYKYSNIVNKYKVKRILNFLKKNKLSIDNISLTNNFPNVQITVIIGDNQ